MVKRLHKLVEHVAEHSPIQGIARFLRLREFFHIFVVELRRALEINLQGGCGKRGAQQGIQVFGSLGDFRRGIVELEGRMQAAALERSLEMQFELLDVAAFLPSPQALSARVVEQPQPRAALYHPVEVIGPHGILVLVGRHFKAAPEFAGDEGGTHVAAREEALVAAEYHYVVEVQGAGLQRAHNLQALERLTLERHGYAAHQLVQETEIRRRTHRKLKVSQLLHGEEVFLREGEFHGQLLVFEHTRRRQGYQVL